jgi:hypothetical protein
MKVPDVPPVGERAPLAEQLQANEDHYKYYLFYANTAVALALVFVASLLKPPGQWGLGFKVGELVFAEFVLIVSARDAITRFRKKIKAPPHHNPAGVHERRTA